MDIASVADSFDCYECERDECTLPKEQLPTCENAIYCWKSTVREGDGTERNNRGCVGTPIEMRFTCKGKGNSQYHIECCQTELCNDGAFPTLKPVVSEHGTNRIKLTLAYVIPLLVLIFAVLMFFMFCRRSKKCCSSSNKCTKQQREEHSQPTEIDSETKKEESQHAGSSVVDGSSVVGGSSVVVGSSVAGGSSVVVGSSVAGGSSDFVGSSVAGGSTVVVGSSDVAGICSYSSHELNVTPAGEDTLKDYLDGQSLTSGSGSGQPLLMQRTLSKQISLVERLNRGAFGHRGELWRGIWLGEDVAVKIYSSRSETLWARETEVYTQLLSSKHENILGYHGSDTTSSSSCTQLWIVMNYHPNGSLRDYLQVRTLEHNDLFKVCLSLVYGLLYLHTEIHGTRGKVSIAHRNLSSKHVLVKKDGTCAIGDFRFAVTQERLEEDDFLEHISKRYMSPELLERTFDPLSLEIFRQADIYSLGLVLWEICRRCIDNTGAALDYAVPYYEWLSITEKPELEEMRKFVVTDQRRPEIPQHWQSDQTLSGMAAIMKECWHIKAAARLPILRIKKTLLKLASDNLDVKLPLD